MRNQFYSSVWNQLNINDSSGIQPRNVYFGQGSIAEGEDLECLVEFLLSHNDGSTIYIRSIKQLTLSKSFVTKRKRFGNFRVSFIVVI